DQQAARNTTSVYTPAAVFPMLPERLSTDLTSLGERQDRLAVVVELTVSRDGASKASDVYGARVRNAAKLAYNAVGAGVEGGGPRGGRGARGRRTAAARRGESARARRAAPSAGSRGADVEPDPPRTRRARVRVDRRPPRLRRRDAARAAAREAEPREGSHREL